MLLLGAYTQERDSSRQENHNHLQTTCSFYSIFTQQLPFNDLHLATFMQPQTQSLYSLYSPCFPGLARGSNVPHRQGTNLWLGYSWIIQLGTYIQKHLPYGIILRVCLIYCYRVPLPYANKQWPVNELSLYVYIKNTFCRT